jgi:parallel beta-helix repeat protein
MVDAVFTVSLSSFNIEQDLFVDYKTVDGTAVASHGDYVPVSGVLKFPFTSSSLTQTIMVPIPAKSETLPVQNFSMVISLPPLGSPDQDPDNVFIDRGTGTATIYNGVSQLQFSSPTFQVGELDGSAQIAVTRFSGPIPTDTPASVEFAITGGTAVAGVDYLPPASNIVTFAPGQTTASFSIPILVNLFSISNKTIDLTLFDATGQGVSLGSPSTAVLTIVNVNPLIVTNTRDSGLGSLRQAILTADTLPFAPTITFDIPGADPHTIVPGSPLPAVTRPMVIDANTQPGYAGQPIIEISGEALTGLPIPVDGLTITGGSTSVRGFVINRFSGSGIVLHGGGGDHIVGNYLGTDLTGSRALPNGEEGVYVNGAPGNTIGNDLISGNGIVGVLISGPPGSDNLVFGNRIGTDVSGMAAVPNGRDGVYLFQAPNNLVMNNTISGNGSVGIQIQGATSTGNVLTENRIGMNASGTAAVPNANDGIFINQAPSNMINGNIVSGNGVDGIQILGAASIANLVLSNAISNNGLDGVFLNGAPANTIGSGNTISGNGSVGVQIFGAGAANNSVVGNEISGNGYGLFINGAPGYRTAQQRFVSQNTITGNRIAPVFVSPSASAAPTSPTAHPNTAVHALRHVSRTAARKKR